MKEDATSFDHLPEKVTAILVKVERLERILEDFSGKDNGEENGKLLTIEEASQYTSLAKQTLYGLVSERRIPFIKREGSKRLYFSKAELKEWLLEGRMKTQKPVVVRRSFRR